MINSTPGDVAFLTEVQPADFPQVVKVDPTTTVARGRVGVVGTRTLRYNRSPSGFLVAEVRAVAMSVRGMDPDREDPRLWPGGHSRLVVDWLDSATPCGSPLPPGDQAGADERIRAATGAGL